MSDNLDYAVDILFVLYRACLGDVQPMFAYGVFGIFTVVQLEVTKCLNPIVTNAKSSLSIRSKDQCKAPGKMSVTSISSWTISFSLENLV